MISILKNVGRTLKQSLNVSAKGTTQVVINGKTYTGKNVSIQDGKVMIDGEPQEQDLSSPRIDVHIHGDVETLQNDFGRVDALNVHTLRTGSGDVWCADVAGNVSTGSGDVSCENVSGSISTGSGEVRCGKVGGSVNSMSGDIDVRPER